MRRRDAMQALAQSAVQREEQPAQGQLGIRSYACSQHQRKTYIQLVRCLQASTASEHGLGGCATGTN